MDNLWITIRDTPGIVLNMRMSFVHKVPSMSSGSRPAERSGGRGPDLEVWPPPCLSAGLARRARAGLTAPLKEAGYKQARHVGETLRGALKVAVYLVPMTIERLAARASAFRRRWQERYHAFMGDDDMTYYPDLSTHCAMLWHRYCEGFLRRRGKWDVPCACYCHNESSVLSRGF